LNYELEPGAAMASSRWELVSQLNRLGFWTAVRWEPIFAGINDQEDVLEKYAEMVVRTGAKHVSLFNYRTSDKSIAMREFSQRGYNYKKMLEGNFDHNWKPKGKKFFEILHKRGIKASSPDFVNFPFDSDCESCCGVDGLFVPYEFTFQHACRLIKEKGSVCWDDMEAVWFFEPESYQRMKDVWNEGVKKGYYSLVDCQEIKELGIDSHGMKIYGRRGEEDKKGLFW
jgi:hypothetical protein